MRIQDSNAKNEHNVIWTFQWKVLPFGSKGRGKKHHLEAPQAACINGKPNRSSKAYRFIKSFVQAFQKKSKMTWVTWYQGLPLLEASLCFTYIAVRLNSKSTEIGEPTVLHPSNSLRHWSWKRYERHGALDMDKHTSDSYQSQESPGQKETD